MAASFHMKTAKPQHFLSQSGFYHQNEEKHTKLTDDGWLTEPFLSCKGPLIAVDMAFIDPALVRINKVCCSHSLLSDLLICVSSHMTDECVWGAAWSDNGCVCVCVMRSPDQQRSDCC